MPAECHRDIGKAVVGIGDAGCKLRGVARRPARLPRRDRASAAPRRGTHAREGRPALRRPRARRETNASSSVRPASSGRRHSEVQERSRSCCGACLRVTQLACISSGSRVSPEFARFDRHSQARASGPENVAPGTRTSAVRMTDLSCLLLDWGLPRPYPKPTVVTGTLEPRP